MASTGILKILLVVVLIQSSTSEDQDTAHRLNIIVDSFNKVFVGMLSNFYEAGRKVLPENVKEASLLVLKAAQNNQVDFSQALPLIFKLPSWSPLKQLQEFLKALRPATDNVRDEFTDAMNIMTEFATKPEVSEAMQNMFQVMPSFMEMFVGLASIAGGAIVPQPGY